MANKTIITTIKGKESKSGKNAKGNWLMWMFEFDGDIKASTFDSNIGKGFNIGDNVKVDLYQNGDFWNIKTMELTDEKPEVIKPAEFGKTNSREATMWASYAKDLIIAGKGVDEAIQIVSKLRDSF